MIENYYLYFRLILPENRYHEQINLDISIQDHLPLPLQYGEIVLQLSQQCRFYRVVPVTNFYELVYRHIQRIRFLISIDAFTQPYEPHSGPLTYLFYLHEKSFVTISI